MSYIRTQNQLYQKKKNNDVFMQHQIAKHIVHRRNKSIVMIEMFFIIKYPLTKKCSLQTMALDIRFLVPSNSDVLSRSMAYHYNKQKHTYTHAYVDKRIATMTGNYHKTTLFVQSRSMANVHGNAF